jgi:hypothetical protein
MSNQIKSYHVYEYSYPDAMPEVGGIVFYVGKATQLSRIDAHLGEAQRGVASPKCDAIRSTWNAGFAPVRRIVFESLSEKEALEEEKRRILLHKSPYLTNIVMNGDAKPVVILQDDEEDEPEQDMVVSNNEPYTPPFSPFLSLIHSGFDGKNMNYWIPPEVVFSPGFKLELEVPSTKKQSDELSSYHSTANDDRGGIWIRVPIDAMGLPDFKFNVELPHEIDQETKAIVPDQRGVDAWNAIKSQRNTDKS